MPNSKHFTPWIFDEPNPDKEAEYKADTLREWRKNGCDWTWHPTRKCPTCKTSLVLCTGDGWCMCENCGEDCGLE